MKRMKAAEGRVREGLSSFRAVFCFGQPSSAGALTAAGPVPAQREEPDES